MIYSILMNLLNPIINNYFLFISFLLNLFFIFLIRKKQEKIKILFLQSQTIKPANLEKDLLFLNFIIQKKTYFLINYVLAPRKITNRYILNDVDFESYKLALTDEVLSSLSENYKKILFTYFNKDALIKYITEEVMDTITKECLNLNIH